MGDLNTRDLDNWITGHYGEDQFPVIKCYEWSDVWNEYLDRCGLVGPKITEEQLKKEPNMPEYGKDWSDWLDEVWDRNEMSGNHDQN